MPRNVIRVAVIIGISLLELTGRAEDRPSVSNASFAEFAGPFLKNHCLDCHSADANEGDVTLEHLNGVQPENVELWKRVWEQVALKEMPPRDVEDQPAIMDRLRLSRWITSQIEHVTRDTGGFQMHNHPSKGNHLDHDLLFGELPDSLEPSSTPARLWRIHPMEHLTRLSALINREPKYNPDRPGLRTEGDFIGPNLEGEIKVYFGLDRVIGWVGGTAAYAAAITGFPPVLSSNNLHGLRSYPDMYSVNGAEATQIASVAEDILRYMANGPDAEAYQFADKVSEIDEKHKHESMRGLAQSLFYGREVKRPLTPIHDLMLAEVVDEKLMRSAVDFLFQALTCRPPDSAESEQYISILKEAIDDLGKKEGLILGLVPVFLDRDALFRTELVEYGTPDRFGRVMLQDQELALAINASVSYLAPDAQLQHAVVEGRLRTREDAEREIERILADEGIRKPRILQFFREFFDYDRAGSICKDTNALLDAGGLPNAQTHLRTMVNMTASTDRLVELILQEDKDVLLQLLTTDRIVVNPKQDTPYLGEYVSSQRPPKDPKQKKKRPGRRVTIKPADLNKGTQIHVRVARVVKPGRTQRELTTLPRDQRLGILTHPAWLVSHSDAMDNHAILRGRWIRERLLGDAVPDVPITVDAMLPDEPGTTLRHRMKVTRQEYCWKCHRKMDPLGLPFEMYNHLGLFRTIEYEKPVDTSGEIINSGDPELDGPVESALEMIDRLAKSARVKQVFVRHAFRFWVGRNENLNDAPILQKAYRAYESNGGSMKKLIAAIVTSDAYLYRTVDQSRLPRTTTAQADSQAKP